MIKYVTNTAFDANRDDRFAAAIVTVLVLSGGILGRDPQRSDTLYRRDSPP